MTFPALEERVYSTGGVSREMRCSKGCLLSAIKKKGAIKRKRGKDVG